MFARFTILILVGVSFGLVGCKEESPASLKTSSDVKVTTEAASALPPCCPPTKEVAPVPTNEQVAEVMAERKEKPPARAGQWFVPAERDAYDLDFEVTDQEGQSLQLSQIVTRPTAVTFMYTRCPDPRMCPLITVQMANLQRKVLAVGLGDKVQLLLISYDPVYDTPERLKKYGMDRGLLFEGRSHMTMVRPNKDSFSELLQEFQIDLYPDSGGSFSHSIEMIIIDSKGRFTRDYQGQLWDNDKVLADLQQLVDEDSGVSAVQ